jgi:hypothetical protein
MARLVSQDTDLRSGGYGPVSLDSALRQAEPPGHRRQTEPVARALQSLNRASQTLAALLADSVSPRGMPKDSDLESLDREVEAGAMPSCSAAGDHVQECSSFGFGNPGLETT